MSIISRRRKRRRGHSVATYSIPLVLVPYNKRTDVRFAPCHARKFAYTSSDRRGSAATKLGWIIVGRRVVVVGPLTTRDGVVAIDPHTTQSGVAWDHSLAGTNDDMSRFGMMPSCGGVRRSTESDQKA